MNTFWLETESPASRQRGKKLSTNKLSALEKLKKARQGEKVFLLKNI